MIFQFFHFLKLINCSLTRCQSEQQHLYTFTSIIFLVLALTLSACQTGSRNESTVTATPQTPDAFQTPSPTPPTPTRTIPTQPGFSPETTPASLASPVCREETGAIRSEMLTGSNLNQSLKVLIYLPPCFPDPPKSGYPLLILLHGQGYDENHWPSLGLTETADRLIAAGEIPPMLIFMPLEEYSLQDPSGSVFDDLLIDTLLPWAEQELPVCFRAVCRAVGGISRGGAWALRLGIDHPEIFHILGLHSAPPFASDPYRLVLLLRELPEEERPHLWIDVGEIDTYRGFIQDFHNTLFEQDIQHTFASFAGGHADAYWQAHLEEYLLWYGAQWMSD